MKVKLILAIILIISLVYSNGGNQKYIDGYLVQVASLPISPFVGEKMSALISFANTSSDLLKDIEGTIYINQNDRTIFAGNFTAPTGTTKFEYTFNNSGLYDMFVEFKLTNETRIYMPDHFLIEVKQAFLPWHVAVIAAIIFLFGIVAGFVFGWRMRNK